MVEAVGTLGTAVGTGAMHTAPARAPTTSPAESAGTPSTAQALGPISPTTTVDPMSGVVVTQYLSETGDVSSQVPSTTAVAYLRLGLTASGLPDKATEPSPVMA